MKKILFVLTLVLVFVFSFSIAFADTHYVSGHSSVDAGEIRWGGSTRYSTQWNAGISTWNALGRISIAPDTIWTYEDLRVSDVSIPDSGWSGRYRNSVGADTLQLNIFYMNRVTSARKQNIITHELGHALGLAHSISGNIMYASPITQTSLGTQDVSDYNYLWGI